MEIIMIWACFKSRHHGCQVIFSCESTIGTKIYPFKNVFGHHKHIAVIWNGPFKNCMLFDVNGEWIISMKFNCLPNEVEKCLFFKLGLLSILNYRDIVSLSIKAFYILFLWLAKFFQISKQIYNSQNKVN